MDKKYLSFAPEVEAALAENRPVVALESSNLSHGMPYPDSLDFARRMQEIIREEGAVPAVCAVMGGELRVGLTEDALEFICRGDGVSKASRRDMAVYLATGAAASVNAATALMLADMAGIRVLATGGIGCVHQGAGVLPDVAPDLVELARCSVAMVCAGAKSTPDTGPTLAYLAKAKVPVIGLDTCDFPAFRSRKSGFKVDFNAGSAETAAWILCTKWRLGLAGGAVVANPPPDQTEGMDMEEVIRRSLAMAKENSLRGRGAAPLPPHLELSYHNAKSAARVAAEYAKAEAQCLA